MRREESPATTPHTGGGPKVPEAGPSERKARVTAEERRRAAEVAQYVAARDAVAEAVREALIRRAAARPPVALRIVLPVPCAAIIRDLESLLEQARCGELIGLAYVASFRGGTFSVDIVGEMSRDPVLARGMVAFLDDEVAQLERDLPGHRQ